MKWHLRSLVQFVSPAVVACYSMPTFLKKSPFEASLELALRFGIVGVYVTLLWLSKTAWKECSSDRNQDVISKSVFL